MLNKKLDLEHDNIFYLLLHLSIPAILSMLVAATYNLVDRIFVGNSNPLGLTAIGITMPFQILQMAFVLLIGIGSSTLISIKYGQKDLKSATILLKLSFKFIIITQVVISLLCLIFLHPLLNILGVSKELYPMAKDYISIMLLFGAPSLAGYCLNNSVRALGFSKESMYIVVFSSFVNFVLDYVFIILLSLGVRGAAIATVISQSLVTVFVIYFFSSKYPSSPIKLDVSDMYTSFKSFLFDNFADKDKFLSSLSKTWLSIIKFISNIVNISTIHNMFSHLVYNIKNGKKNTTSIDDDMYENTIKTDKHYVLEIIQNGLPNFYMQIFATFVSVFLNSSIIKYGNDFHMASITIIISISMMFTMIIYGICQGMQPIAGFNYGAKKMDRAIKSFAISIVFVIIVASLGLIIMIVFADVLTSFFTKDKYLQQITTSNIPIYLLGLPMMGIHAIVTTFLQSIKLPRLSSILYILRFGAILIPCLMILPPIIGIKGVYMSNAVSDITSGIVAIAIVMYEIKKITCVSNTNNLLK